ncbi:MAG: farnesyl diphosphate synthase [Pseudomonadota bacterium]|nr:farnesyl diphosphate synthase [Pseudomonadota bacterium]
MNEVLCIDSVKDALVGFGATMTATLDALLPEPAGPERKLFEAMRYSALANGKFLRPYLVRTSALMFDVAETSYLRAGAAVEMVHTYSLIHDDLPAMDNDDMRRGSPSCHKAFDEATAILAGDALLTLSFGVLSAPQTHPDAQVRSELVTALADRAGGAGMVGGQVIDLASEHSNVDAELITRLETMKTGALIAFSTAAGGILGQAGADIVEELDKFGFELGLAFQITDDLLDVEGDEYDLGKKVGKDAESGKATFVSALGVDGARREARQVTDRAISRLDRFGMCADEMRSAAEFVLVRNS